jgi:hypothetical protein
LFVRREEAAAVGTYMSAYIEVDHGERSPPFSDPGGEKGTS